MWKVNAGRGSQSSRDFLDRSVVAIGWREAGDITGLRSKDAVFRQVAAAYPDNSDRQNEVGAGQVWRFLNDVRVGNTVITYDPIERLYHLGEIVGPPAYRPDEIEDLPVQRAVRWTRSVSRDALSRRSKGKLGAILTLFRVEDGAAAELEELAAGTIMPRTDTAPGDDAVATEAEDPFGAIEDQALERIKDKLGRLAWDDMQEIVAALLRALGYRTIVSPAGPDRGKDIVASRDGFGFEPPRIVVEVKHRRGQMGAPEIRAFLGGRHAEDRGLYVSTGGFTREAHFEAERASNVTHLMTLDGLARAIVANYETMDERGRALLPLTRLY